MLDLDYEYMQSEFTIPFDQVQKNLQAVFEEYGVTESSQSTWLYIEDFYWRLLDSNGQFSERGRETMERWKASFGDFYKEMDFSMYMVD